MAGSAWEGAVDRYLDGDKAGASAAVLGMPAAELTRASAQAFDRWRVPSGDADARRLVVRRLQASALLPLDVLVTVTDRGMDGALEAALEDASREAWRRLGAFDDGAHAEQVKPFRTWWRLGVIQYMIAAGRFPDIRREIDATRVPDDDPDAVAAVALLRGVALETRARLADEPPGGTVAMAMRRLPQPPRVPPMLVTMDEAGKAYRRALEATPDDREATLRLARIALERSRPDEAERLLTPLLAATCRDAMCGLAYLFLGELHEARKDLERASGAYARASSVPAVRSSALIAMIQASLRRGNARGAYELTRQFGMPAALAPNQPPDAWSQYIAGYLIESDRILARLSAAVVK